MIAARALVEKHEKEKKRKKRKDKREVSKGSSTRRLQKLICSLQNVLKNRNEIEAKKKTVFEFDFGGGITEGPGKGMGSGGSGAQCPTSGITKRRPVTLPFWTQKIDKICRLRPHSPVFWVYLSNVPARRAR